MCDAHRTRLIHIQIEVWCETYYPSYVGAERGKGDVRSSMIAQFTEEKKKEANAKALASGAIAPVQSTSIDARRAAMTAEEREAHDKREQKEMITFFVIIMLIITFVMLLIALAGWLIAWYVFQEEQDPLTLFISQKYKGTCVRPCTISF